VKYDIVLCGVGGQGGISVSVVIAKAAMAEGLRVKQSEVHGMSQRGGSVTSDVRFGAQVLSPMVPAGEADVLVVLAADQVENNRWMLKAGGALLTPELIDVEKLENKRSFNVAMLGALSAHVRIDNKYWQEAIRSNLPEKLVDANLRAFAAGRSAASDKK